MPVYMRCDQSTAMGLDWGIFERQDDQGMVRNPALPTQAPTGLVGPSCPQTSRAATSPTPSLGLSRVETHPQGNFPEVIRSDPERGAERSKHKRLCS